MRYILHFLWKHKFCLLRIMFSSGSSKIQSSSMSKKHGKKHFWQKSQIFDTSENEFERFLTLSTIIMIVGRLSTGSAVHARIISRKGRARAVWGGGGGGGGGIGGAVRGKGEGGGGGGGGGARGQGVPWRRSNVGEGEWERGCLQVRVLTYPQRRSKEDNSNDWPHFHRVVVVYRILV